ncbi:glycosyltransferase [Aureimonas psammosilenae]|uniref:glycosyltransferase n=1 Tax=Aureimonas psammosilenae TaxID=2495496 RepID=UPI001260D6B5|nr:glycosyltransferase [Aureimonas psammosilenae]
MRVLVIAHGHVAAGIGGGELAADNLFRALKSHPEVREARLLARVSGEATGGIEEVAPSEHLWRRSTADWFWHEGEGSLEPFRRFLGLTRPDAVFLHHFAHLGLDILPEIRRALPDARIVLTLHDFAALCHSGGVMTRPGFARVSCGDASPANCHRCFPDRPAEDFARRRAAILERLAHVDRFVSPSRFVKARHAGWGIDPARIAVIENGLEPMARLPRPLSDGRLHLGFFGQARAAKGLDLALAALHLLPSSERARLHFHIHASRLEAQPVWYRTLVERLREPLLREGCLSWPGAYARTEVAQRMAGLDFVVVPSTWEENAPFVIQEAFGAQVPVIGANHGGIAEKVRDGVDGLLFEPRDAKAFAALLSRLLAEPKLAERLAAGIRPPQTTEVMGQAYLALVRPPLAKPMPSAFMAGASEGLIA